MASGYQKSGNDLDNILAAYVSGDPHAPATNYNLLGVDLNQRYSKLSRGTAPGVTGYEVAGADFNTIFAAKGTVLHALTLFPQGSPSSTLSTAAALGLSSAAGTVVESSAVDTNGTGWGEMIALSTGAAWPSFGAIHPPTGKGMLWDAPTLAGTSIPAGTWTIDTTFQAGSSSNPANIIIFIVNVTLRVFKRSSTGVYTSIGSGTVTGQSLPNSGSTLSSVNTSFSAGAVSFGTGDKLYADVWVDITTNLTTGPFASFLQMVYSSVGSPEHQIITPGYVIA